MSKITSLYEIVEEYLTVLDNLEVDQETGEILNVEKLDKATEDVDTKIENITLYIKNLNAEIQALKNEETTLKLRRQIKENKVNKLKDYLTGNMILLGRNKFETSKCYLSFRKSKSVEIIDLMSIPEEYIKKEVKMTADKTAIKKAIESNGAIAGARVIENKNLQIK